MMNNKNLARLAILTLCLTFVSTSLLGGTLAMYTSEVSATATATVADWSIEVEGTEITVNPVPSVTFDLFSTVKEDDTTSKEDDVATGSLIAPGTGGTFTLDINNLSEVSAKYEIALTAENDGNIPIEYSKDGTNWVTDITSLDADLEGELLLTGTTSGSKTIYWKWEYETGDDPGDTALGTADNKATVTVKADITVTQLD